MIFGLGISGYFAGLTWPFFTGLAGVGGHLFYQTFTLKMDDPQDCWNKFRSNISLGLYIFLIIVAGNLLRDANTAAERRKIIDDYRELFS